MDACFSKIDAKGQTRIWSVKVADSTITYVYGIEGGKMQHQTLTITEGKVKRTPHEQAMLEATAKARTKQRAGYVLVGGTKGEKVAESSAAITETAHLVAPRPMLAQDYDKRLRFISFETTGVFCQRKLDGCRALVNTKTGEVWSRTRKQYTAPRHIGNAVKAVGVWVSKHLDIELPEWLDGELYIHGETFNAITSLVRQKTIKNHAKLSELEYHIYDVVMDAPYRDRLMMLHSVRQGIDAISAHELVVVETETLDASARLPEGIMKLHAKYTAEGYEGVMVRLNNDSIYEQGKRSSSLLKVKTFMQEEFVLVECLPEKGAEHRVGSMVLRMADGRTFNARPAMTEDEREALWDAEPGAVVTVKFFTRTPDGVPRFPSALGIRDDVVLGPV